MSFKHLKDLVKQYIIPVEDVMYDGIIEADNPKNKLLAKQFICPRCKGNNCGVCPDVDGKKYLMCLDPNCAWEVAEFNKEKDRKRFLKNLLEGRA